MTDNPSKTKCHNQNEPLINKDSGYGECGGQLRRHDNRHQIDRLVDNLAKVGMANDLQHHRVGEADHRNDGHRQEKVVDVAAELEVNWLRKEDRLHQLALGRLEVRPYDNRPRAFSGPELADLYDGRTAEENVAAVASVVVQLVLAVSKGRLGDGAALAGEHRLVDDHLAGEEDRVKVQLAAKTQKISINLFKNYPKKKIITYLPSRITTSPGTRSLELMRRSSTTPLSFCLLQTST